MCFAVPIEHLVPRHFTLTHPTEALKGPCGRFASSNLMNLWLPSCECASREALEPYFLNLTKPGKTLLLCKAPMVTPNGGWLAESATDLGERPKAWDFGKKA